MHQKSPLASIYTDHVPDLDEITQHTKLPETRISKALDSVLNRIGDFTSWIWVVLMLVVVGNVLMRYVLGEGRIEFEELQWHLYAFGWVLGLSYCFVHDDHVRVDLVHEHLSTRTQAWIELLGMLFLLLPFIGLVLWYVPPFIAYSFELGEVSSAPGGLPFRWLIKSVLFIGFILLAFAMVSRLSRVCSLLFLPQTPEATPPTKADSPDSDSPENQDNPSAPSDNTKQNTLAGDP